MKNALVTILTILTTALSLHAEATFSISGSTIYHPNGYEFIPIGANVVGWNFYDWENNTVNYAAVIEQAWKFNIVRANLSIKIQTWNNTPFGVTWKGNQAACQAALDAIINAYTAKKIVVMLEVHDWTGDYPRGDDLVLLNDFYRWAATRYKNNTYVWFNIINEPQWNSANPLADPYWITMHRSVISLIRDSVGASNVIVCDGVQCGQEAYTWNNYPIYEGYSAILSYGDSVKQFNNKAYANIAFSFHAYDQWGYNYQLFDAKMDDFVSRIQAKGHAVMVGEVGARGQNDSNNYQAPGTVYRVCIPKKVGMLAWHFAPGDGFSLVSSWGYGSTIDSWTNPTNLSSWCGTYFWKATHEDGLGLRTATRSSPMSISIIKSETAIRYEPQNHRIVIDISGSYTITVTDLAGRVVLSATGDCPRAYDVPKPGRGVRLVSVNRGAVRMEKRVLVY